jgi:hypothetical protein
MQFLQDLGDVNLSEYGINEKTVVYDAGGVTVDPAYRKLRLKI